MKGNRGELGRLYKQKRGRDEVGSNYILGEVSAELFQTKKRQVRAGNADTVATIKKQGKKLPSEAKINRRRSKRPRSWPDNTRELWSELVLQATRREEEHELSGKKISGAKG